MLRNLLDLRECCATSSTSGLRTWRVGHLGREHAAREALLDAWGRSSDERVEVACRGGRGRTGTALACLAVIDGVPAHAAVGFVRENYHRRAVETPWQRRFVAQFAT